MAALVDLVPPTRVIDANDYVQPLSTVVDVSGYKELALMLTVHEWTRGTNDVEIFLATAMENREDSFLRISRLANLQDGSPDIPYKQYCYCEGTGSQTNASDPSTLQTIGFARYIRIETDGMSSGSKLAFDVQVLLKGPA